MELNKILQENEQKKKEQKNTKKFKKPIQLREIESNSSNNRIKIEMKTSMNDINEWVDNEKKDILKQKWNRLNNGSKYKLLNIYILEKKEEYNLTD